MVKLGIDVLLTQERHLIAQKRLALVSNYTMTDARLIPVIDRLQAARNAHLVRLFGPEHGVLNASREGEPVKTGIDAHSGLPAVSLYGDKKAPEVELLRALDAVVIDLADIGSRYYTNPSTLYYTLQAAEQAGIQAIVLDRPNPIGGVAREGHVLDPAYQSFVGMLPVPIRHGLTFGEEALLIRDRFLPTVDLVVVPTAGWERHMLFPDTGLQFVPPSPNTIGFAMTLLYPGTCLFEGTNVSLGRGTPYPFTWLGAPWSDGHAVAAWFNQQHLPGVIARPVYFTPARSWYAGELVSGVALHIVDAQRVHALKTGVTLIQAFLSLYPDQFRFGSQDDGASRSFFDLLAGGPTLREAILSGRTTAYFTEEVRQCAAFTNHVAPYLLYT